LAGLFQLVLGILRAGLIGDFIPSSVIKGMLTAIGLILILKQIPHAVGFDKDYEGDFSFAQGDGDNTFTALLHALDAQFTPGAILIAFISLVFLFSWEYMTKRPAFQRFKSVPGPLVVVLLGVALNELFKMSAPYLVITPEHLVSIPVPESAAQFLGQFKLMNFNEINNPLVWTSALTLGAVASIETLLSIEAVDRLDPFKRVTPTNRELMAQGVGNMVSGMIGGMPVTSVIVRSSANVTNGGRTQTATIVHGLLLLFCAAFIPFLLNKIPLSALAAILIATGYKLTKPAVFVGEYKRGYVHLLPFLITVVAIMFTDLLKGVFIGVLAAAVAILWDNFKSAVKVAVDEKGTYLVKINRDLSFIHKAELKRTLSNIPDGTSVWLNISKIGFVDLDNAEIIRDFVESAQYRSITVHVVPPENPKIRQHILN
jgi:MFS superfamily sulfate permease-like transporter